MTIEPQKDVHQLKLDNRTSHQHSFSKYLKVMAADSSKITLSLFFNRSFLKHNDAIGNMFGENVWGVVNTPI